MVTEWPRHLLDHFSKVFQFRSCWVFQLSLMISYQLYLRHFDDESLCFVEWFILGLHRPHTGETECSGPRHEGASCLVAFVKKGRIIVWEQFERFVPTCSDETFSHCFNRIPRFQSHCRSWLESQYFLICEHIQHCFHSTISTISSISSVTIFYQRFDWASKKLKPWGEDSSTGTETTQTIGVRECGVRRVGPQPFELRACNRKRVVPGRRIAESYKSYRFLDCITLPQLPSTNCRARRPARARTRVIARMEWSTTLRMKALASVLLYRDKRLLGSDAGRCSYQRTHCSCTCVWISMNRLAKHEASKIPIYTINLIKK